MRMMDETNDTAKCPYFIYKIKVRLHGGKSQNVYIAAMEVSFFSMKLSSLFGVGVQKFHATFMAFFWCW